MSNEVTIDEAQLTAEADAVLAGLEPEPALVGDVPAQLDASQSWVQMVAGITPMLRMVVFPQWGITDEEATEFQQSLGESLDQLFPGGPAGKYACYVRLLACCGGIVAMRALMNGGKLPPIGPKRPEPAKNEQSSDRKDGSDAAH